MKLVLNPGSSCCSSAPKQQWEIERIKYSFGGHA